MQTQNLMLEAFRSTRTAIGLWSMCALSRSPDQAAHRLRVVNAWIDQQQSRSSTPAAPAGRGGLPHRQPWQNRATDPNPPSPDSNGSGELCQVFWGTHGCTRPRGHAPEIGHYCCCTCEVRGVGCVGHPPYYGPTTHFYGEDA